MSLSIVRLFLCQFSVSLFLFFSKVPHFAWLECTENYIFASSCRRYTEDPAWIAVVDRDSLEIVKKWCTEKPAVDCCYNKRLEMIFSAHPNTMEIIGWDLQGKKFQLVIEFILDKLNVKILLARCLLNS